MPPLRPTGKIYHPALASQKFLPKSSRAHCSNML
jgi:hypothetical protein